MVSTESFFVLKRNEEQEKFNLDKIHAILERACEGLTGVSVSDIEMNARLSFHNGITTTEIHRAITKAACDLISEVNPNYQYVSGRLLNYDIRKTAWGGMEPPRLYDHIVKMVKNGYYHTDLLEFYSEESWDKMDAFIDHDRDFNMSFIGVNEYMTKYSVRNRSLLEITPLETPQITYILIAALMMSDTKNLRHIKSYYNDISLWNISLPTPIMAGLRSPTKQFSSCVLLSSDDSLKSIGATTDAIMKYVAKKAGIGIDASSIRAEGSSVGKEKAIKHTGVTPYLRLFESSLKSSSQGGIRGGAGTCFMPLWHREIQEILVLKNNKGTQDTRVRKLDYGIQINNYLYKRFIEGKTITLFSPNDVRDLYDAFFSDQETFAKLYEKYERDNSLIKKVIQARDLFTQLMIERKETGRIYIFNVDNVNAHSNFRIPIKQSNLCMEITLPTVPMGTEEKMQVTLKKQNPNFEKELEEINNNKSYINVKFVKQDNDTITFDILEDKSECALCTLSRINLGNIKNLDDLEGICRNAVKGLDNLLSYQEYPLARAYTSTRKYRPLGIGIINLAYYLAKNGLSYNEKRAFELIHETMEAIQYYCLKASMELAKEKGSCLGYKDTKFSHGLLSIDHYNKNVDEIVKPHYNMDWKWLKEEIKKYGVRNSTLLRMMPAESSAKISNATNGVEPIRSLITTKGNKDHISKQVVPELTRLKNKYDFLWNMDSMEGIIKMMAVIQKFTCQSVSTNLSYNPEHFENHEIPLSVMLRDILLCNKYGLKTLYYNNVNDMRDESLLEKNKESSSETVEEIKEEECDSCVI